MGPEFQRPSERAFIIAPLLRRFRGGKRLSRIEQGVPKQEIERAMILGRVGSRDDLDAAASGSRELRRIWVVVDFHFLNSGCRYREPVRLQAVHYQRDATGGYIALAQESGHGTDVIYVENGNVLQSRLAGADRIAVLGGFGADVGGFTGHGHLFPPCGQPQNDAQRGKRPRAHSNRLPRRLEARLVHLDDVRPSSYALKAKHSVGVRLNRAFDLAALQRQSHFRPGNTSAGRVTNRSEDQRRAVEGLRSEVSTGEEKKE